MDRKKRAAIISIVFQPTFIPIILYLIVSFHTVQMPQAIVFALIGIIFVTLAPIGLIFLMTRFRKISDPDLPDRRERFLPYISIVVLYIIGLIVFLYLQAPWQIIAITASYIAVTFAGAVISLFWKISMHLAGVSGPITALVFLVNPYFAFAYLLLLPIGWARYALKKHTLLQIIIGSLLSIGITYMIIWFLS